ncbi:hypothetical protein LSTR_LSTR008926 [Laodelphax striatellus]|uniref:PIN domain-containing protein n=1 Tax=Laodelphax striatellus TaxID=195883 RepID=A0A482WLG3_LAOST|nr:hypothetical protein LSTR_LSTR008926 [Laodelphax striatellus]
MKDVLEGCTISNETMSNYKLDDDALKGGKRVKPPVEIYRPGSGPLPRKTGRGEDEVPETILPQKDQRKFGGVGGEREKPRGPGGGGGGSGPSSRVQSEVNNIMSALLKVQDSRRNNEDPAHSAGEDTLKRNRNRKPESKLYVAKHSQNQQTVDDVQEKSVKNNNRLNSFKEGNNRVPSDTNMVERNQSMKGSASKVINERSRGGTVSDDENSNSQSLASGRRKTKKVKNDRRKTKRKGGGGGGGMRNDANRQVNGFQEHQPEKTSQPSSRGQESVTSDTYDSSNSNFEHANNNINTNRNMRHASEPRVMPTGHHYGHQTYENSNRATRDTHSMEHNDSAWNLAGYDKGKPRDHVGNRRHIGGKHNKTNHHSNAELPPRFQKKKQMESSMKHIGTTSADDQWDGSSLVIHQQNSSAIYSYPAPPPPPPTHHPLHPAMYRAAAMPLFQPPPPPPHAHQLAAAASMPTWHNPMPMSRGRGRLRTDMPRPENMSDSRNTRSLTPERHMYAEDTAHHHRYGMSSLQDNYSSPQYDYKVDNFYEKEPPPPHQSNDNLTQTNTVAPPSPTDKPASHKSVESDVHSVEKPEVQPSNNQMTSSTERLPQPATETNNDDVFKVPALNSLDWVEEIERTERLQARSDLSRSTSVNSLHETSPRPKEQGSIRKRRDSRRKKRQGGRNDPGERSPSRESRGHRGSHESLDQCQWRRGEKENLSWRANSHERSHASGSSRHNSAERWQHGREQRGARETEWFRGRREEGGKDRRGRYRNGSRERRGDRRNRRGSSELWSNKSSDETNWRNELRPPEPRPVDTIEQAAGAGSIGGGSGGASTTNPATGQKSPAGILVLPASSAATMTKTSPRSPKTTCEPVAAADESYKPPPAATAQRQLFNPNNPNEPIIVATPGSRAAAPPPPPHHLHAGPYDTGQYTAPHSDLDKCRNVRDQQILSDIERCEYEIGMILNNGHNEQSWGWAMDWRNKLLEMQRVLLVSKMNFCQEKNIEQRIWKAVFHNIIEFLRKMMTDFPDTTDRCKDILLFIIQDGMKYYEDLLSMLESVYKIKFEDYLHSNPDTLKDLGLNKLTLVSAQKIYLCLGDLARYKDQVNEKEQTQRGGPNYGIARQWYVKAQQMNPKNGRPYNQLAVVSCYGRRKLDAVYFYMRSLMSSNPFQSAREPLLSMFDDNRKKWESGGDRVAQRAKQSQKDKEGAGRTRREIWIRPDGGKRVLRTTSAARSRRQDGADTDEEEGEAELKSMCYVDLNKRFCVSFLHVHGKLFTKVGMESFQEAGLAMLREFRVLLQHSPLPLTVTRFLQLLALNMFAIENTQLKNTADLEPGYRSATQECALIVSLQMFNLIVERCVQLLQTADTDNQLQPTPISNLTSDVHVLLPAIKVWCDWLLCHSTVWNPPPSCRDYRVGPSGDAWTRLATLVNLLEKFNTHRDFLSTEPLPDSELVRLPEDVTLSGFTPLMYNTQDPIYTNGNCDMELAQISLRIHKIMFFGTEFLCGVDPPVLKLQKYETGVSEYVSVVEIPSPPVQTTISCCVVQSDNDDDEVCLESSEEEEEEEDEQEGGEGESDDSGKATGVEEESSESSPSAAISNLRKRKEQLERSHRKQERRRQKVQAIVRECEKRVEMEVRPHYLVPDTNCLIDYLAELAAIANAKSPATNEYIYSLVVPLVVMNELEGLSQGACKGVRAAWRGAQHTVRLAEAARNALHFLRSTDAHPPIKGLTTHGNTLNSSRFTDEQDYSEDMKNDDKILTACLNLSRLNSKESKSQKEDGSRRVLCEVVLLTEDRNLKLKALARDMPVSDMPNFIKWAGLGLG